MTVNQYIDKINNRFKQGNTTEHSFRGDLQTLIETLCPDVIVTNEAKRISCGAPDYIITKKDIPIGYIEAKDIGDNDLLGTKKTGNKEQFERYRASLNNLIFTDYLEFHLFIDGQHKTSVKIAQLDKGKIIALTENIKSFENLIKDFCIRVSQTIKSPQKLAEMMAGKARMLADVINRSLDSDVNKQEDSSLKDQMSGFRQILIHDIKNNEFADIYAQTIAYGMFAARLHDPTLPTFSRQEAAELIPKTNPFLRKLFGYIAGPEIDFRIVWIVDSLANIFRATDVASILKDFGKSTQTQDPIIHFYETFLSSYDPALRKARGVWYTPEPVVSFIVNSVDNILRSDFNLKEGLADTSKIKIKQKRITKATSDLRSKVKETEEEVEVHRLQILDPATGTGTFLAEVMKNIQARFKGQEGIWSNYVENHLIPRLNGFELLMASYAMAHLKLDLILNESGYQPTKEQRFRIYLTNSLEEYHPETGTLFANWLSAEANEANHIKRDTPVMCVIGNPPYSGESANQGEWIYGLMEDYKKEPGGREKLKEKNSKAINADEYKFIRYGQHFIEKNGSGILAFINPHTFLDGPVFRGMRWNLLKTFDKIYILDLHGNSTKKETAPDGTIDENVFDIKQGVSINIFVKTGKKKSTELGKVFHLDLYGTRALKYNFLSNTKFPKVQYNEVSCNAPNYYFVPKDFEKGNEYKKGFSIVELMPFKTSGIKTHDDENLVSQTQGLLENNLKKLQISFDKSKVYKYSYRPFDFGYIYYDPNLLGRAREKTIVHLKSENIGLILVAQPQAANINSFDCVYLTNCLTDTNMFRRGGPSTFPLYLYSHSMEHQDIENSIQKTTNLNSAVINQIAQKLKINYKEEYGVGNQGDFFTPVDILDYIYAVLHSPIYREKYWEFLKTDFPRIPYPKNLQSFKSLVKLGNELREIHLMVSSKLENDITTFPITGNSQVNKIKFEEPKVYINDIQYFNGVSKDVWNFSIGGYEPAQKWLKDRKNRDLNYEDILNYQKVIIAIHETINIMDKIKKVSI